MSKVKVYSTTWCGFCHQLKDWLKEKGVEFDDINIEEDQDKAKYVVEKTGQMGVPVTEIGDEFIIGFDRAKIEAALAKTA